MTEKLKTLRDFEIRPKSWAAAMAAGGRKYNIDLDGLRQEAIKHLKYHKKHDDTPSCCSLTGWIEDFFNIKKDDLK